MAAAANNLVQRIKESLIRHADRTDQPVTEHELCQTLGVGRSIIRDALGCLQDQGLIERRQKKGTSLRRPGLKEIVDLWDTRCALEAAAVRIACATISEADLDVLRNLCDRRDRAGKADSQEATDQLDIEFHQKIIDCCGNLVIKDILQKTHLFDRIFRISYSVPSYWANDESQPYGHPAILDALAKRDSALAEDLMRRHIQEAKKRRFEAAIGKMNLYS